MKIVIILNDALYGNEKAYNGLRIANQLNKEHPDVEVRIFLLGDAVTCAIAKQSTPNGYYNIERMLLVSIRKGAQVKICGSCAEARGLKNINLIEGTQLSSMAELTAWIVESEKIITF